MWKVFDYLRKLIYRDGVTPLPFTITAIVYITVIFYAMASSAVFAFLPKMVKLFGASELSTGYYAGIIASSIYIGRFLFSMLWGYLTDVKGKKFCSILAGLCLLLMTLAFGFSHNFYWATLTRFLQGCSMGQIIISKAILVDVSDDTNMALGISVVMSAFSFGLAIGPSVGGFVAFPADQYPTVFSKEGIFGRFGILLPNLIIAIGLAFGVTLAAIYLPRDRQRSEETALLLASNGTPSYGVADDKKATFSNSQARRIEERGKEGSLPDSEARRKEERDTESSFSYSETRQKEDKDEKVQVNSFKTNPNTLLENFMTSRFVQVLQEKECRCSSLLYGLFSFVHVGFSEIFPVLAATNPAYRGLGFSTSDIGTVLVSASVVIVVLQLTVLPKLTNYFGSKKMLIVSNVALTFLWPMLPVVAAVSDRSWLWACILLYITLVRICISMAYLSINILLNNSVVPALLGSANGFAMTVASVGRFVAPLITGSIYSWSLTNIKGVEGNTDPLGFPFNQFLAFYTLSVFSIVIAVFTSSLPDRMNFKKTPLASKPSSTSNKEL